MLLCIFFTFLAIFYAQESTASQMTGYEKFDHYEENPPPAVFPENGHYPVLPLRSQAYLDYNEGQIRERMAGHNGIPLTQVGVSIKRGGNIWHHENIQVNNGQPLTIPEMMNMALEREVRNVPIQFNDWPPNANQFARGGYNMPLARALHNLKTRNPQPNYLIVPPVEENHENQEVIIASEVAIHFNLFNRTSKNMRDVQTNGVIIQDQNTIKSLINYQRENARGRINNIPEGNPSSMSVVSYIASQQN